MVQDIIIFQKHLFDEQVKKTYPHNIDINPYKKAKIMAMTTIKTFKLKINK